jgi:hypothetical protein
LSTAKIGVISHSLSFASQNTPKTTTNIQKEQPPLVLISVFFTRKNIGGMKRYKNKKKQDGIIIPIFGGERDSKRYYDWIVRVKA